MCMEGGRRLQCVAWLCLFFRVLFLTPRLNLSRSLSRKKFHLAHPCPSMDGDLSIHIYPCIAMLVKVVPSAQLFQPKRGYSLSSPLLRRWRQPRCRCVLRVVPTLDTRIALAIYSNPLLSGAGDAHPRCYTHTSLSCAIICAQQHPSFDCCAVSFDNNRQYLCGYCLHSWRVL